MPIGRTLTRKPGLLNELSMSEQNDFFSLLVPKPIISIDWKVFNLFLRNNISFANNAIFEPKRKLLFKSNDLK